MTKRECAIDIETYSSVDIDKGVYAYADSPDFEILLVAYKFSDDDHVRQFMPEKFRNRPGVLTGAEEQISMDGDKPLMFEGDEQEFLAALTSHDVIFTAFNANFERTCLARYYGVECDPDDWRCTMVLAAVAGLPRTLKDAGEALGLSEDEKKLRTGKALIQYFCKPVTATKSNGMRVRNLPKHDMARWRLFCEYNLQDVVTEQAIRQRLKAFQPNAAEQKLWSVDQHICDRGIRVDRPFVEGIVEHDLERQRELKEEAKEITGLENPNSVAKLKEWFKDQGVPELANDLSKDAVDAALKVVSKPNVRRMLQIRKALGKTSTVKYQTMLASMCSDNRVRGMLKFYGANRTGRWSGSIVQLQNLPQNHIPDLDLARQLTADRDFDSLELLYGETGQVLSELVRTAFIPSDGNRFVVTDFSAIEARVIAWLAGEEWRLDVFRNGGDIYCQSASQMFHVPVVKHGINGHLRQQGKIAELACGYGGGIGAIKAMDKAGAIPDEEIQDIIDRWREASPAIVKLWSDYEKAAITAVREKRTVKRCVRTGTLEDYSDREAAAGGPVRPYSAREGAYLAFEYRDGALLVRLPSGRKITYWGVSIDKNRFGRDAIHYMGTNQTTHQWCRIETYGGRLVENLTQSVARDCLAEKLIEAEARGYKVVAHIHDEMIIDVPRSDVNAATTIDDMMAEPIPWAPGLPLKGGTYECDYYQKD